MRSQPDDHLTRLHEPRNIRIGMLATGDTMTEQATPNFIFLDGDTERKELVEAIKAVRRDVLTLIQRLPEHTWYTPRYHDLTPAAVLAHLNTMDNLSMLLVKSAVFGLKLHITSHRLNQIARFFIRIFRKRLVKASVRSAQRNEKSIARLIMSLPMDKYTRPVFYPLHNKIYTLEQAVQLLFLQYWQEQLAAMQEIENMLHAQPTDKHDVD